MKRIEILTLFPDAVQSVLDSSILRRAQAKGIVELSAKDHRKFGITKSRNVDDTPFGGGQGMLFRADVLESALNDCLAHVRGDRTKLKVIFATPRGIEITQDLCQRFADWLVLGTGDREKGQGDQRLGQGDLSNGQGDHARDFARRIGEDLPAPAEQGPQDPPERMLLFVCGRYEGVDERFVKRWVDFEFSLGDFIVTGGELPALAFVDGIVRLLPGVLGDERSSRQESFTHGLLEHPQYTKPREVLGQSAPATLLEGNHLKMEEWKLRSSLMLTFAFRPDLIRAHTGEALPKWAKALLAELQERLTQRS